MPRQAKLAPGRAVLALSLGLALALGVLSQPASAAAETPKASEHGAGHSVVTTLEKAEHEIAAHESPSGKPNILEPQPNLAIWTVVVFVGLLLVLTTFAWKPLLAALHQREEHLEHVLLETERARNESEQLLAEHRRRMSAAEEQVRALIEDARKNAAAVADGIFKQAQAEADASRQRAEREIATAKDQALAEIWSKTAELAVSVAGRVLNKSLTEDEHRRLIDTAVAELPAVRPSSNGSHAA